MGLAGSTGARAPWYYRCWSTGAVTLTTQKPTGLLAWSTTKLRWDHQGAADISSSSQSSCPGYSALCCRDVDLDIIREKQRGGSLQVAGTRGTLHLTEDGILPPGCHVVSPRQVKRFFVDGTSSQNRHAIYEEWRQHRSALKSIGPVLYQWIGGSFATNSINPADIDVATFIDGIAFDRLPPWKRTLISHLCEGRDKQGKNGENFSHIDCKMVPVFPRNDPRHSLYLTDREFWRRKWSRTRSNTQRGFLEVK
ncbi:DUF6932 family protein [Nocardiopsis sp. SBT366]|uniref:DUF6932 family protein n=1 Tax=Nocardiopsis sp. SBT366 TaxID=1580529 RepID=UPI000B329290